MAEILLEYNEYSRPERAREQKKKAHTRAFVDVVSIATSATALVLRPLA